MGSERESAFSVTAGVAEDEEEPHLRENVEREGRFSTLVSDPEATASSASISPYLRSSSESLIKSGSSLDHMEIELDGIPRFRRE